MSSNETPFGVANFERLMYASIVLDLLQIALFWQPITEAYSHFTAFDVACYYALLCLFIWLVARKRKKWPRWVLLALFVLALVPQHYQMSIGRLFAFKTLGFGARIANALALLLIFASNDWFEQMPSDSTARLMCACRRYGKIQKFHWNCCAAGSAQCRYRSDYPEAVS